MTTLLDLAELREVCRNSPKDVYRSDVDGVMFVYRLCVVNDQLSLVRRGGPALPEHFVEANHQLAKMGLIARLDVDSIQPHGTCCRVVAKYDPSVPRGGHNRGETVIISAGTK